MHYYNTYWFLLPSQNNESRLKSIEARVKVHYVYDTKVSGYYITRDNYVLLIWSTETGPPVATDGAHAFFRVCVILAELKTVTGSLNAMS